MPGSPPTNAVRSDAQRAKRDDLKALDVKRKALESEAAAIVDELMTPSEDGGNPMGVDTPLTDVDGYPRADIDVYRARALRHRLNEIRTDHKALMKKIEHDMTSAASFTKLVPEEEEEERKKRLAPKPKPKFDPATGKWVVMNWDGTVSGVEHGDELKFDNIGTEAAAVDAAPVAIQGESSATATETQSTSAPPLVPFAIIDGVANDSPAKAAGLHEGDLVVQFGTVNHLNHKKLKAVLDLVPSAAADRKEIPITILRRQQPSVEHDVENNVEAVVRKRMVVKILPRPWSGRGLLGCHIKGYAEPCNEESR